MQNAAEAGCWSAANSSTPHVSSVYYMPVAVSTDACFRRVFPSWAIPQHIFRPELGLEYA